MMLYLRRTNCFEPEYLEKKVKLPDEDVIFCLEKLRSESNQLKEHSTDSSHKP